MPLAEAEFQCTICHDQIMALMQQVENFDDNQIDGLHVKIWQVPMQVYMSADDAQAISTF